MFRHGWLVLRRANIGTRLRRNRRSWCVTSGSIPVKPRVRLPGGCVFLRCQHFLHFFSMDFGFLAFGSCTEIGLGGHVRVTDKVYDNIYAEPYYCILLSILACSIPTDANSFFDFSPTLHLPLSPLSCFSLRFGSPLYLANSHINAQTEKDMLPSLITTYRTFPTLLLLNQFKRAHPDHTIPL